MFFWELEWLILLVHPLFGHQPQAAEVSVTTVRFTPALDFESLAVRLARKDK